MDDRRFDAFVRSLASGQSRRAVLKGLLGLGGLAAIGVSRPGPSADAARRPAPTPTPAHRCPGKQTWNGSACTCPSGSTNCGPDCCPDGQAECCDNACCYGDCYGEELCCPTGQSVCNGVCCDVGEQCFAGECQVCTPCGSQCCSPDGQCCQSDAGIGCAPAGGRCCTGERDCRGMGFCDGLTAHTFACVNAVCTESVANCQGSDPCYNYSCDQGICGATRDSGCCATGNQCDPVDACTPANCINGRCNTASSCGTGEHCCGGACVNAEDRCCATDGDCAGMDFCSDSSGDAYHYSCVNSVCTRSTEDCLGDDACISYGCANGACTTTPILGCCSIDEDCTQVDDCTPGVCFDQTATCNTVSNCTGDEHCCADGGCSEDGACNRGCTIEGVDFSPCKRGCPTCVAPDGGTLCGCGRDTGISCTSSADCLALYVEAICAGRPGTCVVPSTPVV